MADGKDSAFKNVRSRQPAHPDSPAGGSGPGFSRAPGVEGRTAADSANPPTGSPAGRFFPWRIELPAGEGDGSFQFFRREGGLTGRESALLKQAHNFFGLEMGAEGKIAGVLIFPDGTVKAFVSGKHGGPHGGTQRGYIPRGKGSGVTRFNVTHIEGHAAADLHRAAFEAMKSGNLGVGEAALLIPKEPCGACDPHISSMLPSGSRLFVVDPEATTVYRSTSGPVMRGPTFTRPPELHFDVPKGMLRLKAAGRFAGAALGMVALNVLAGWLLGKIERSVIDKQMKELEPQIEKELQNKADQVLDIVAQNQKAYANIKIEIWSVLHFEPEMGGPVAVQTLPVVTLKSVSVSNRDINIEERVRHEFHWVGDRTDTTPITFSFEVGF